MQERPMTKKKAGERKYRIKRGMKSETMMMMMMN